MENPLVKKALATSLLKDVATVGADISAFYAMGFLKRDVYESLSRKLIYLYKEVMNEIGITENAPIETAADDLFKAIDETIDAINKSAPESIRKFIKPDRSEVFPEIIDEREVN